MSLFKLRTDYLTIQPHTYGAATAVCPSVKSKNYRLEITREYPIETIWLRVKVGFICSGVAAAQVWPTVNPLDIIDRVTLTVADGARTRNVVDASGAILQRYAAEVYGRDHSSEVIKPWLTSQTPSNGTIMETTAMLPIFFAHPQVSDPVSSALMLPCTRYTSNPVLSISTNTTSIVPAADIANINYFVEISAVVDRRDVDDPNWEYWDTELTENIYGIAIGRNNIELPIPGAYTGLTLITSDGAGGTGTVRDISRSSTTDVGDWSLQYLGNVIRRFRLEDIGARNEGSKGYLSSYTRPGIAHLDFLTDRVGESVEEIGSVLETNFLMATGARLNMIANATVAGSVRVLGHRIFGDVSKLKMLRRR
jgi:hypothetical protein